METELTDRFKIESVLGPSMLPEAALRAPAIPNEWRWRRGRLDSATFKAAITLTSTPTGMDEDARLARSCGSMDSEWFTSLLDFVTLAKPAGRGFNEARKMVFRFYPCFMN